MASTGRKIVALHAYVVDSKGGADYMDQDENHWIVQQIATPMSIYPEYKATRTSFGINVLKTMVIELEADDGTVGFGITTGGYPAAWLAVNHLNRFVIGKKVEDIEIMWDQMFKGSIFYGRKGLVMNTISAIDLAAWDLLGRIRDEPIHAMIGGKVRDELEFYATGPRPDIAKELGFIGGKMPLVWATADREAGLRKNMETAQDMRSKVGDDFMLMWDCWMSCDLQYAQKLQNVASDLQFKWIEECFMPDDYWAFRDLKRTAGTGTWVTTGEHEASLLGFRMLLEFCDVDVIQPDVGWCGGLTELIKIGNLAEAYGKYIIPHGSGPYSQQYVCTKVNSPFTEWVMSSPKADKVVPQYYPLLEGEVVPVNGRVKVSDKPGFGVELNKKDNPLIEILPGTRL